MNRGSHAALEHRAYDRSQSVPMIVAPECARAYPGPLQIEAPVAIPDATQASFRDDEALPRDWGATDPDFAHSVLVVMAGLDPAIQSERTTVAWIAASRAAMTARGGNRSCR